MRAMLIDDHPVVVETMKALVMRTLRPTVLYVEETVEGAIRRARQEKKFDLVVLDLTLPGVDAVAKLRAAASDTSIVVLSAFDDPNTIHAALRAGAQCFIKKTLSLEAIEAALRLVVSGEIYVPPCARGYMPPLPLDCRSRAETCLLTGRQKEVLQKLAHGSANRAIARELNISTSTVKQHTRAIFHVLGVASRTAAVSEGIRRGLISFLD